MIQIYKTGYSPDSFESSVWLSCLGYIGAWDSLWFNAVRGKLLDAFYVHPYTVFPLERNIVYA